MNSQQMETQQQKPIGKRFTWVYWVGFAVTIAITLFLVGLVIWIISTQDFTQASSIIGLLASIIAIVSAPLIFLVTIAKRPVGG